MGVAAGSIVIRQLISSRCDGYTIVFHEEYKMIIGAAQAQDAGMLVDGSGKLEA
jgi:hypothetical protein